MFWGGGNDQQRDAVSIGKERVMEGVTMTLAAALLLVFIVLAVLAAAWLIILWFLREAIK